MAKVMVLYFYDDKQADALADTLRHHPENMKEMGEFVQNAKVVAVAESHIEGALQG